MFNTLVNKILIGSLGMVFLTQGLAQNVEALLPDERNTVEIFRKISPQVVYVHRIEAHAKVDRKLPHPEGAGTGMLWDEQGHVVTNYHVIRGAQQLNVTLGTLTVPAKIIGKEPRKDIALLQITSPKATTYLKNMKPFEIAHRNDLVVGQKAIAIGNPFGLDHTLTTGVVSALGREVPGVGGVTIHNMVQTDTPINPGNSGGPLLNSAGQLIGMNTMIFSRSGTSAGIGFAVPAEDLSKLVDQLIKHGRAVLSGIGIQPVDPESAEKLGVKKGILIHRVLAHTPASGAKLHGTYRDQQGRMHLGDVIVAVNAHPVPNYDVLYHVLSEVPVGDKVTVTLERAHKRLNIPMKTIDVEAL